MLILLIMILMIFMLVNLLMIISNIISKKTFKDREKKSPFECGFDPKNSGRLPFSLKFLLIAIMFLIFDVEITFLLPSDSIIKISNFMIFNYMHMFFILILLKGLYHEWNQGVLIDSMMVKLTFNLYLKNTV